MTQPSELTEAIDKVAELSMREWLQGMWDATIVWFNGNYSEILIGLALAAAIVMAMIGCRRLGERLYRRDRSMSNWISVVGRTMAKTRTWFMVAIALEAFAVYANTPLLLTALINLAFSISMVIQIAIWARAIILGIIEHRTQTDEASSEALGSAMKLIRVLVTFGVGAIAAIVVLDNLNVDVTGLIAGLGVAGIAIGLAAQGIFSDLFAALSIIFDKPFKKGDAVSYDNTTASVEQIGLRSTRLRSVTGEEKIISNTNLLDKEISNLTRLDSRRIKFALGVVYQTDPDLAARVPEILEAVVGEAGHKFVRAGFVGFGDSSLDYQLEFDVMSPVWDVVYNARHTVGIGVFKRFAAEGLEFAYPTQTTFTAAPDGEMILPYADVKMVATEK